MATRKLPSRARSRNSTIPTSTSLTTRARPVAARTRLEPEAPSEDVDSCQSSAAALQPSSSKSLIQNDGGDSHIHVVIRCRRRSEREIQEASPIIISSEGPKGRHITIETAATTSILGVVTLPPTRTYPFDVVFGPEADQSMVYNDVVHPMLEEVLKGYNCTLFAYGQTGTGKTYTMQGDLSLSPLGNPSAQAGMVPRALFKLFHHLESSVNDYSVKISYVELYNEELRDLLASELTAPTGTTQPMGMGGPKDGPGTLRIFEDSSKKGVLIQGLEEVPVKDFNDALALLDKGSQRRQIAATKFNDHSSRSHSVFSITVHTKETSTLGDDLLRVGKLNLVDLAGSENIGRSGAENKRAREAGMINQSLLTLGRVINALVDKSSHVPYRESKLTRLLQDSLGGRTKTCIIATVSPARSNMEETLSTLDYAMRAKSIRNKPEVNQRMSRNALLKDYISEIERLKSDLLAAREKNGIYFSEETWAQINTEHELRQTEAEEAKKQVELIESQMRSVRDEFEQSIALLMRTDGELKTTKERLRNKEGQLQQKEEELEVVKVALEEEEIVRRAHAGTEDALDGIAKGLKQVVEESTRDVSGLFGKIERKKAEFDTNAKAARSQIEILNKEIQSFSKAAKNFSATADRSVSNTKSLVAAFIKAGSSTLSEHHQFVIGQTKRIQDSLKSIQECDTSSDQNLQNISVIIKEVQDCLANELSSWSSHLESDIQVACTKVAEASSSSFSTIEKAIKSLGIVVDRLLKDARLAVEAEKKHWERENELLARGTQNEIARLKKQNAHLSEMLEAERKESHKARDNLLKRITTMLSDYSEDRDKGLRSIVSNAQNENLAASTGIQSLYDGHNQIMNESSNSNRLLGASVEKGAIESGHARLSAEKGIQLVRSSIQGGLDELRDTTVAAMKVHSSDIMSVTGSLNSCSQVFERERRIKRARVEAVSQTKEDSLSTLANTEQAGTTLGNATEEFEKQYEIETSALSEEIQSQGASTSSYIMNIQRQAQLVLQEGTRQSDPTGSTPQKRKWSYTDKWERTRPRSQLINEYHQVKESTPPADEPPVLSASNEPACDPESDSSSCSPNNDDVKSEEHIDSSRASHASINTASSDENVGRRDSLAKLSLPVNVGNAPLLKMQAPRITLQEKSVNIIPEPRTRITRNTRRR